MLKGVKKKRFMAFLIYLAEEEKEATKSCRKLGVCEVRIEWKGQEFDVKSSKLHMCGVSRYSPEVRDARAGGGKSIQDAPGPWP